MKTRMMAAVAATTLALSMGVATAGEIGGAAIDDGTGAATQNTWAVPDYQLGYAIAPVHSME